MLRTEANGGKPCVVVQATSKTNNPAQELRDSEGVMRDPHLHRTITTQFLYARNADECVDRWWDFRHRCAHERVAATRRCVIVGYDGQPQASKHQFAHHHE